MNEPTDQPGPALELEGFDALYRGDYDAASRAAQAAVGDESERFLLDRVPWDIGEAQPVVRELEDSGQIHSEVLDVGCGPGDNALFLAGRGYRVCGVDGAPAAIEAASERARARGLDQAVEFAVAEATTLAGYRNRFTTVIDSALYHCLTEQQRATYAAAAHRACQPGARLHLVCFSDAVPESFPGPYRITQHNLRTTLTPAGWAIQRLEPATYTTAFTRGDLTGQAPAPLIDAINTTGLGYDHHDRLLAPAWLVTADRQ